ncbi:MAG TPA: fumarylacetoacetate hydrolase family protein, partial [Candidatus Aquilonibacter sp.]
VRENYAYDIALEIQLQTEQMRAQNIAPVAISQTNFREMYWNVAQQLAHMTSNGSRVRAGDLFGTGTISGREPGTYGSLIELSRRGAQPIPLPSGETRAFLEDGDTIILHGWAGSGPARVDFGEVRGTIVA